MLTYPSDPLPQIVCPMDEVALPQNHFCSAPAHSQPSPPLPLFPSITPSSADDGTSETRRSDGLRRVAAETPERRSDVDTEAAPERPTASPSLPKRDAEDGRMVRASDAKHPRLDREPEVGFKDGFDAGAVEDGQNLQKTSQKQTNICPAENVATHSQNLDPGESDMDTSGECVGECDIPNAYSLNKWVIGPLFQSLKSKISSFTEIVITPVKALRASSSLPSNPHTDDQRPSFGTSSITLSALGGAIESQAQSERETEDPKAIEGAHEAQTVRKCCKKLNMDSEGTDECPGPGAESPLSVPLPQSPWLSAGAVDALQPAASVSASSIPLYLSVAVSASQESKLSIPSVEEELKGKPPLRKDTGDGNKVRSRTLMSDPQSTDVTNSPDSDKIDPSKDETVLSESDGRKREMGPLVGRSLQSHLSASVNGRILRSSTDNQPPEALLDTETAPAVRPRRPKRDLKGGAQSENAVKRKRVRADQRMDTQSQELQRPTRQRQVVSAGANKKGELDGAMLASISEAVHPEAGSLAAPPPDNNGGGPGESWKVKPKKTRRLKTHTCLGTPDLAGHSVDLETTIQIRSTKRTQAERLAQVLCHRRRTSREEAKNPQKRKSPEDAPPKVRPAGVSAFGCVLEGRSCKVELKRPKKALGSEGSRETKEVHLGSKENGSQRSQSKSSVNSVYFEMTPGESGPQYAPLPDCYVKLGQDVADDGGAKVSEPFPTTGQSRSQGSARVGALRSGPRNGNQRRTGSRKKEAELAACVSKDDSNLATPGKRTLKTERKRRLLRSFSCPEISALRSSDAAWNSWSWPHHSRTQPSHQHTRSGSAFPHPAHRSAHRARRHTVCSVELERELAPLCLRKEVYPSRRSAPYDASGQFPPALSPGTSLSALASCFLSSPLAFLSKKSEGRGASASPGSSGRPSSPTSSSPSTQHRPGFTQQPEPSGTTTDPRCESVQCETQRRQERDGDDDGGNSSSSSQELEDVGLREEKAFSDSEVKVLHKQEERGKVSSIRIRKTLPKPQNNLTPMGLPKAVRVKKKDFSLEEIYTNKNFNKPRESRLETIFEVPASRKNGSVSSFGQKRIRRFLEFLEVGEARKAKKPLVGVGKAGASASRTRRGGFLKDAAPLGVQDVDSLLCAKLHQLTLWLIHDQSD